MPNKVKYIGFMGTDSYDLILYLAVMLTVSKRKVLLLDKSSQKALTFCIPVTDMAVGKRKESIYDDLDFREDISTEGREMGYDFILSDFGQNAGMKEIKACDTLFIVTDTGLHNMAAAGAFSVSLEDTYLLIRDIPSGLQEKYIYKLLQEKGLATKKSYYFSFDETDKEAMAVLQYGNRFCYKKLSPAMKYFIREVLGEVFEIEDKDIKLAEKELKRRG